MNNKPQEQYKARRKNNQPVLVLNSEILLPEDAPVRMSSAQHEEPDYRKLYEAYSSKGRKSATDPRVMFKVMVYGYPCGIFSTRALAEACKYRVDFMWLLKNDFGFRRFLTTGNQNVYTEMVFLAFGFNLKKRWMKQQKSRLKTHYSENKIA